MPKIDLTTRFINTPLLLSLESADSIRMQAPASLQIEDHTAEADAKMFDMAFGDKAGKPYRMAGNVAIIPISGTLLHRVSWSGWGITGYDYVRSMFDLALADPDVAGIVFDVNSGGGEVAGAFDLADHIYSNRDTKPSMSIVDEHAYSAAYLLGSAAGQMSVPQTGGAGSIGVVTMHADMSKMLDKFGIDITFIHAGKHKVDGNPYEPLSADVRKRIQARIDDSYNLFVDAVSRQRGLSAGDVKATEAQTFSAQEALDLGLVDAVASPIEAMTAFVAELNGGTKETVMAQHQKATPSAGQQGASASGEATFTQADLDNARAEGFNDGSKAERERHAAVLASEHYKGRETLAVKMLGNAHLSADEVNEMLSATPVVDKQASAGSHFEQAMSDTPNPNVGADMQDQGGEEDVGARMLRHYQGATGMTIDQQ